MRKILFLLLSGVQMWAVQAQPSSGHTPPFLEKSLSGAAIRQVTAETSGGNISVTGVPDGEARLEVYIRPNNGGRDEAGISKEEIQRRLNTMYDFAVTVNDNKLTATARPKRGENNWREGLSISFKIYIPQAVSSTLRTSGGNITLKNLNGTQDFRTSGGNLDLDQLSGKLTGRTSGGNISLTDSKDDIDLTTSGGNIEAIHCDGNIRLITSGGNLKLRLLKGTIHATTSGGSVQGEEIAGELQTRTSGGNIRLRDLACSLTAATSAGDIDITFKTLGKFLDLTNSSGDISLELPQDKGLDLKVFAEKIKHTTLNNFKGDIDEHHLDGTMNGGGIPVKLDDNGGRVSLSFK